MLFLIMSTTESGNYLKPNQYWSFSVHIYFLDRLTCNCSYLQIFFSLGLLASVVWREECPGVSGCNGAEIIAQDSQKS